MTGIRDQERATIAADIKQATKEKAKVAEKTLRSLPRILRPTGRPP